VKTVTKSELARRLRVVPSMVSRYVAKGMPLTRTGRVNLAAALSWHKQHIVPERSGSFAARLRKEQAKAEVAPQKPEPIDVASTEEELNRLEALAMSPHPDTDPDAYKILLDHLLSRRGLVAGILASVGIKDPILLHCADDVFAALVVGLMQPFRDLIYPWNGADIPLVETDYEQLTRDYGVAFEPEVIEAADKMAEAVFAAIEQVIGAQGGPDAN